MHSLYVCMCAGHLKHSTPISVKFIMLIDGMPKSTDIVDTVAAFGYFWVLPSQSMQDS